MKKTIALWINWLMILLYSGVVGMSVVLLFLSDQYYFDLTVVVLISYLMIYLSSVRAKELIERNYLERLREIKNERRNKKNK